MMASIGGHVRCVQLLLDKGAQVNHQDEVSAVFTFPHFQVWGHCNEGTCIT